MRSTSLIAYKTLQKSGVLSKRRWEIYQILFYNGPMTSNEIFQFTDLSRVKGYRHNTNARMTELRDMGLAQEVGMKDCSVTDKKVILWDVTDRMMPVKLKRKKTRKQLEFELAECHKMFDILEKKSYINSEVFEFLAKRIY